MTPDLGKPFWHEIKGLGDWVYLTDLVRVWRGYRDRSAHYQTRQLAQVLIDQGCEVDGGGKPDSPYMIKRADMPKLRDAFARIIAEGIRRSGSRRQEILKEIDRPEFRGMELTEIFERLAEDAAVVMETIFGGD